MQPDHSTHVEVYDTTLRDGTQGENVSLSVDDKLKVTHLLDDLGVAYIEGGWPGSNPKDAAYFQRVRAISICKHARDRRLRHDLPRRQPARRRCEYPGAAGRRDARRDRGRQNLAAARVRSAAHHARRKSAHHPREPGLSQVARARGDLRRRAFLRRLQAGRRLHPADAAARRSMAARTGWCCAIPTAARCPGRSSRSRAKCIATLPGVEDWASTPTTTANWPWPIRWRRCGRARSQVQGTMNGYGERCGNANLCADRARPGTEDGLPLPAGR